MKKLILIVSNFLYVISLYSNNLSPNELSYFELRELINDVVVKYKNEYSISFDIQYKQKSFLAIDTSLTIGTVDIIKVPEDPILKSSIWIHTKFVEGCYNNQYDYLIFHENKKIIIREIEKGSLPFSGSFIAKFYEIFFLDNERLINFIEDSKYKITVTSDSLFNKDFWKIIIIAPNNNSIISDVSLCFWINKSTKIIEKRYDICKFQGDYQYSEWNLFNVVFNNINLENLQTRLDTLLKKYKNEDENEIKQVISELKPGMESPNFKGHSFDTKQVVSLKDFKNNIIILDFFYMSCYPCILAIPHLVKLYDEYKERGVEIFGINSIDNNKEKENILKKFIETKKINYPIIMTDRTVDSLYSIPGYPTLYLIDKKGKIAYSTVGFSESVIDSLRAKIEEELKK